MNGEAALLTRPADDRTEPRAGIDLAGCTDDDYVRSLHDRFGSQLFAFVLRLTQDRYWADDVVQLTLIRAWRRRDQLANPLSARSWLFTIAYRVFADDCRSRSTRPVCVPDEDVPPVPESDQVDRLISAMTMSTALDVLSPEQRRAIGCVYYLQRTVAETAQLLDVPVGTVKSRLHYGLRTLRGALDPRGVRH